MFQPATIRSVGIEQRWNERQRDFHRVSGMVVRPSDPACTQLGVAKDSNDHSKRPVSGGVSSGKNESDPRQPSMRASVVYRRAVVLLGNRRDRVLPVLAERLRLLLDANRWTALHYASFNATGDVDFDVYHHALRLLIM